MKKGQAQVRLTKQEMDQIHNLFCAAIGKQSPKAMRLLMFRDWQFDRSSHWGEAVAKIVTEGAPQAKRAATALRKADRALNKARQALQELKRKHPQIYAGVESWSTSPAFRSDNRLAIRQPVTASPPLEEIQLILSGVNSELYCTGRLMPGMHPIYGELSDFWCAVTKNTAATSSESRMVRMIGIACHTDPESVSRYLRRAKTGDKSLRSAPKASIGRLSE